MAQSVADYIDQRPPAEQPLWYLLREVVLGAGEQITETLGWGIPFFETGGKKFAYLNPRKGGIELCFTLAHKVELPTAFQRRGRKMVAGLWLTAEPTDDQLLAIAEAIERSLEWFGRSVR